MQKGLLQKRGHFCCLDLFVAGSEKAYLDSQIGECIPIFKEGSKMVFIGGIIQLAFVRSSF